MAGIAKPDVEGLGKEGEIIFLESDYNSSRYDKIETLVDGDINKHTKYGVLLDGRQSARNIIFEIPQKSNIWAYGQYYSDSAGSTPKPINIYKKNDNGEFELIQGKIPTKVNEWYLFIPNLDKGIYKAEYIADYVMFTEWYIEDLQPYKFLIKQNNQYYTIKPEHYQNGQFQPLTLEGGEQPNENDYENFGFDDLNDLLIPIQVGEETFKPYDKLNDEFEICMATDKETTV